MSVKSNDKSCVQPTIKHYFAVVNNSNSSITSEGSNSDQEDALSEVILLSTSEEEEEESDDLPVVGLRRSERLAKPWLEIKNRLMTIVDPESETFLGITEVINPIEDAPDTQQILSGTEEYPDSQELLPCKRKKRNRVILDSQSGDYNDEDTDMGPTDNSTQSGGDEGDEDTDMEPTDNSIPRNAEQTESSDNDSASDRDSIEYEYSSDVLNEIIEAEDHFNSYREPDPRFIHEGTRNRRRTKSKTNEATYDDHQQVSIHKINLNHNKLSRKSVEDAIEFIVDEYNKDKQGSSSGETKNIFKWMRVGRQPVLKPEDEEHFVGEEFEVAVYVQKVAKAISLLRSYGIKERATTIHCLIFHYRTDELFAVTTNQSWNVVQWCSDFEFPGKIAARILSKHGELESTNKGLVGTESTRKTTHKQQKKTNPYDLLTFCTTFKAEIRKDASILKLSCFRKQNSIPVGENGEQSDDEEIEPVERQSKDEIKGAKMTVSLGNIRILKRFSTSDILSILSVLSEISKGNDTFNLNGRKEQDSSAHKKYLTAVHTEISNELNVCLSEIIHDAIADNNRMVELDNFQFSHKHLTDFFNAHTFELSYKDSVKVFKEIPTLRQIVAELRRYLGEIPEGTTEQGFLKLLNNVKMSYCFGTNEKKKPEKLLNYVDGLLFHSKDNSVYWHVNANWCHVQDGYINLVHDQFKKILTNCLLTDKSDPAFLSVRWPKNENFSPEAKLGKYLQKYANAENVWTSDNPERDIVEMIQIGKDDDGKESVFFVYYFLPDLNNKTNMKCNRVAESIMQIGKVRMTQKQARSADVAGSEDARKQLIAIYRKVIRKPDFATICPNVDKFLQMVTGAKFYLAIGREVVTSSSANVPTLANEKEMATKITSLDIVDMLETLIDSNSNHDFRMLNATATTLNQRFDKSRCSELAESIHQQLRQHEYIEADGDSVRGKLLSVHKGNFKITDNRRVNEFLYEKVVSKFQPRACAVFSKLVIIDLDKEISKLNVPFNLIEIPI